MEIKKRIRSISAIAMLLVLAVPSLCLADGLSIDTGQTKAVIVMEAGSAQVIFSKNADEKLNCGGLVRLPALLYAAECMDNGKISGDTQITVSPEAAKVGGATAFLKAGESLKAEDAMRAAVMITAGDATIALAEACSGGHEAAVREINARLIELGITQEISSIDGKGTDFSAEDMAKLGAALAASKTYREYSGLYLDELIHENGSRTELVNQNRLIKSLDGCFSGSTGSSAEAGYCGVFMVKRNGAVFIAAVIGAKDSKTRFAVASKAVNTASAAVSVKTPVKKGDIVVENAPVLGGIAKTVSLAAAEDVTLLVWDNEEPNVLINANEEYQAPIRAGDKAGAIEYSFEKSGMIIKTDLVFTIDVPLAGWGDFIGLCIDKWVHR